MRTPPRGLHPKRTGVHQSGSTSLHAYVQPMGHTWLGDHLDSLTLQKLASRGYGAANRLLLGTARRVASKGGPNGPRGEARPTAVAYGRVAATWNGRAWWCRPARIPPIPARPMASAVRLNMSPSP